MSAVSPWSTCGRGSEWAIKGDQGPLDPGHNSALATFKAAGRSSDDPANHTSTTDTLYFIHWCQWVWCACICVFPCLCGEMPRSGTDGFATALQHLLLISNVATASGYKANPHPPIHPPPPTHPLLSGAKLTHSS